MEIKTGASAEIAGEFLAERITEELNPPVGGEKKVLWFITGGSSIHVAIEVAKLIKEEPHQNLTITLTDERYGEVGHPDSNWQQLLNLGFNLPGAKILPILIGESLEKTTLNFNKILEEEIANTKENKYRIALFGIGADGHIAGNLPGSEAVNSRDLAFGYHTEKFDRVTMTPRAIEKLDEVVVFMKGEEKQAVLEKIKKEFSLTEMPSQILKKINKVTIFYAN